MTNKSPFEQILGLVDTALDAVTEVVAANFDAPAGKRETDPVLRILKGIGLSFGIDVPPTATPSPKQAPQDRPASAWSSVTADATTPPAADKATPTGYQPTTPTRLAELENLRTFCAQAATMLSAGVSPLEVYYLIASEISSTSTVFASDVAAIGAGIRHGRTTADVMSELDSFPPMLVELVRVGEIGGHLDGMFAKAADYFRDEIDYLNGHPRRPAAGEYR